MAAPTQVGNYRWMICVLLLFAAIINYVDRLVIHLLSPRLEPARLET